MDKKKKIVNIVLLITFYILAPACTYWQELSWAGMDFKDRLIGTYPSLFFGTWAMFRWKNFIFEPNTWKTPQGRVMMCLVLTFLAFSFYSLVPHSTQTYGPAF